MLVTVRPGASAAWTSSRHRGPRRRARARALSSIQSGYRSGSHAYARTRFPENHASRPRVHGWPAPSRSAGSTRCAAVTPIAAAANSLGPGSSAARGSADGIDLRSMSIGFDSGADKNCEFRRRSERRHARQFFGTAECRGEPRQDRTSGVRARAAEATHPRRIGIISARPIPVGPSSSASPTCTRTPGSASTSVPKPRSHSVQIVPKLLSRSVTLCEW